MRTLNLLMLFAAVGCADKPSPPPRQLGLNLSGVVYYNAEIVFADLFKQSKPWVSQKAGKPYGEGGPLAVNEDGWVEKLNGDGQFAEALMAVGLQGHYPGGNYVCLYDGDGEIDFAEAAEVIDRRPGRIIVKVTPGKGAIALHLKKTNPEDPVRNIRVLLPGTEATYREKPFYQPFLDRWKDFKTIRFMDWGHTNGNKVSKWSDRRLPTYATQGTEKGVALEYQIGYANTQNVDAWFCIPHLADDDYVRQFAKLVKEKLKPDLKVYVEYSNECWHGGFEGGRYCGEKGKELGLSKLPYEAQLRYYAQRSVEIFKIVEEVFGGRERLVRVVATQPDSDWAVNTVFDWKEAGKYIDALAVAPYFGQKFGKPGEAEKVVDWSLDQLFEACRKDIDERLPKLKTIGKICRDRGIRLIAYEGGQHLVGADGQQDNEKLTKLFQAANRDPRMADLYLQDLHSWQEAGGGLFCVFASTGWYSKWGSWGVLEWYDQAEDSAPKLKAIREYMEGK